MFVDLGGAKIHVNKVGQGDPVLLLHGVPDSSKMWDAVVEELKDRFTCYAPDLPGFNLSGIPSNYKFTVEGYGQFINQLVEKLGIKEPLRLVLHDWGGIFGMSFACQFPDKVSSITGGSFPFTSKYSWHTWARVWRTPLLGELSLLMMNKPLFKWESRRSSSSLPAAHINETYSKLNTRTKQTILKLYRSASPDAIGAFETRMRSLPETVDIQTFWGAGDIYVDPKFAAFLRPRKQTLLENCGHWVPVEAPKAIAGALLQYG